MIYLLAIAPSLLSLALLGVLVYVLRSHAQQSEVKEAAWRLERIGLLNRILHPQIVPVAEERTFDEELLTPELDDIDLVGTVVTGTDEDG